MKMKPGITVLLLTLLLGACTEKDPVIITPDNKAIDYVGRFHLQGSDKAVSDWPGTYIRCRFTGTSLGIRMEGDSTVSFNVFIDDMPAVVIACNNENTIMISDSLPDTGHTLLIAKRTESFVGQAAFKGLMLDYGAKVLPYDNRPGRKIEFIGNSITCGYGVEGASRYDHFKAETENNYLTYAAVLSRTFEADYNIIAHSGLGIVRHYGDSLKISSDPQMPARYNRVLDNCDTLKWDFSSWRPDLVVINLGTNDFSTMPYPDKEVFQTEYENLIKTIINNYGKIPVLCVCGPLIDEPCSSYIKEVTETVTKKKPGYKVSFISIPRDLLNCDDDFGSDEHPSVAGQRKIAAFIAPQISEIMGWNYSVLTE